MPRLASGRSLRAHRVRPSERTSFHVISGPAPARPLCLGPPAGGAGSARPRGTLGLHRGTSPLGEKPPIYPSRVTTCLGIRRVGLCGRTECAPPRNPAFASSPGLLPLGHFASDRPPEGRALHARIGRCGRPQRGIPREATGPPASPSAEQNALGHLGRQNAHIQRASLPEGRPHGSATAIPEGGHSLPFSGPIEAIVS